MGNQIIAHPHQPQPTALSQIISPPFMEQSPYLAAIPVQPVVAPPNFPTSATVISTLPTPPDFVHGGANAMVLTPSQNQIQDHLQRKHEELQKLIVQQQDELRRVSEQLFMARYGLLPSIVNVSLPFVAPIDQTDAIQSGSRCINAQPALYQDFQQHPSQIMQHHVMQTSNSQHQAIPQSSVLHSGMTQQQQMNLGFESNPQKQHASHIDSAMESDASGSDMYMHPPSSQHSQSSNIHQIQQSSQQQIMGNEGFEMIPYQIQPINQPSQVVFPPENNNGNDISSS